MTGMPPTTNRSYWDALLAAEGLPAEPRPIAREYRLSPIPLDHSRVFLRGRLHELVTRVHQRREDAVYYDQAAEYLWRGCRWGKFPARHRVVWELHALEGLSLTGIARRLRYSRRLVWLIVRRHRNRMLEGQSAR